MWKITSQERLFMKNAECYNCSKKKDKSNCRTKPRKNPHGEINTQYCN